MGKRIGKYTIKLTNKPKIVGSFSVVGKKEGQGPFKDNFHHILKDDRFGEKSYESAEKRLLEFAITNAIDNSKLSFDEIDLLIAGDLMNQITSSSFSARELNIPFLGLYSACSAMTEGLAVGACLTDSKVVNNCAVATASHFATVEKTFRLSLVISAHLARNGRLLEQVAQYCLINQNLKHWQKSNELRLVRLSILV